MDTSKDELAGIVLHRFLLIFRHLRQRYRQLDGCGMRPRQAAVLRFLAEHGPATAGDVQSYLYVSPSTASAIIAHLEEVGHVTRERCADDHRVVIVAITEAGRSVLTQMPPSGVDMLRRGLKDLDEEKLQRMDEALTTIMQIMEDE